MGSNIERYNWKAGEIEIEREPVVKESQDGSEDGVLHPSPVCRVVFGNGKVLVLNRRDRRKMKLYGDMIKRR